MGQYYKPIILSNGNLPELYARSWEFNNGAKLTEHSYIGNTFVGAIEYLIEDSPANIVWAGDYADAENAETNDNLYNIADNEKNNNIFEYTPKYVAKEQKKSKEYVCKMFQRTSKRTRYIINNSTRQYVDKTKCPTTNDEWELTLNPLPLLTAEGNGRGGGDYNGNNEHLVGTWARDEIYVSTHKPTDDFEEIIPNFMEYGIEYKVGNKIVTPNKKKTRIKVTRAKLVI